jgi:glutamine amidotransferase
MLDSNPTISLVDYGVGNLYSLLKAFKLYTKNVVISEEADIIKSSDALVLPGVGSFQSGMHGLRVRNLTNTIKEFAKSDKPILGICLGAQLLLSKGYEFGEFEGLDIISGRVTIFPKSEEEVKMPHIGWNEIYSPADNSWDNTILDPARQGSHVYFIHSYILSPTSHDDILALSNYGSYEFCSAVKRGKIYGCQFHPEKSGEVGLKIIKKFIDLI